MLRRCSLWLRADARLAVIAGARPQQIDPLRRPRARQASAARPSDRAAGAPRHRRAAASRDAAADRRRGRDRRAPAAHPAPSSARSSATPTTPRSTASAPRGRSAPSSGSPCPASAGSRSRRTSSSGDVGAHARAPPARRAARGQREHRRPRPARRRCSAGPPYGDGVLIIILWANPNPAGPERHRVSEERYRQERARIEQGHVKYREKLQGGGQALRPRPAEAPARSRHRVPGGLALRPQPGAGHARRRRGHRGRARSAAAPSASWPTTTR